MTAPLQSARFWLLTVAALAGVVLTASLGFWQMSRAGQKLALQHDMTTRAQMPPLDDSALLAGDTTGARMHRRVVLRGVWMTRHTVFLENRQMGGKPGFFVVTPLRLQNTGAVVAVQRGWVQRNFSDRVQLPAVPTDAGLVQVEGRIAPPPSKLYEFSGADQGVIRQNLDMQRYAAEIGAVLLPVSVLQTAGQADGLQRDWHPVATGVEKHHGYAVQWFALAILITVLYVWFQIVQRVVAPR